MKNMLIHLWKTDSSLIKLMCVLLMVSYASVGVSAQQKGGSIKGIVLDNDTNEPLIGVNIKFEEFTTGTITDVDGNFTLPIQKHHKTYRIVFSYIGYETKEVTSTGIEPLVVKLIPQSQVLDQVVVVGYGVQKKSDVTGSVATVSKDRIENTVTTDITQLLQGSVPGLNVMSQAAGADPGAGAVMLVRGRNSISANNEPLIILDGAPYYGSLSDIGTNEIESINVLKDASSAAIYGARAAAGVILIETKKGTKGRIKVTFDGFYGIQKVANYPELMNGEEYLNYKNNWANDDETDADAALTDFEKKVYESGSYKDWSWKDLLVKTGNSKSFKLGVSGGGDNTRFNFNASYLGTDGIVINDEYKRLNSRLNVTSDINKYIKMGNSVGWTYIDRSGAKPPFVDAFNKSPLAKPFNDDGTVNINPTGDDTKINPLECRLYDDLNLTYSLTASNYVEVKIPRVNGLSYKLNTNVQYGAGKDYWYQGTNTKKSGAFGGEGEMTNSMKYSFLVENIINYQRTFAQKHDLAVTGLFSFEESHKEGSTISGKGFSGDERSYYGIHDAKQVTIEPFVNDKTRLHSYMARVNYAYDSRYLLTATVRHDASSTLGRYKHWGTFPSMALGWNIHNEKFYGSLKEVMNTLKLRLSVGKNGQSGLKPYSTLPLMDNLGYTDGSSPLPGYVPGSIGSPNLGWEVMTSYNIGLDFAFLRSRITGELNVYRNLNKDLLLKRTISSVHGIQQVMQNIGKTENSGVEVALTSNNITLKEFSWQTGISLAWNKNKIKELYGDGLSDITNKWFIGHPVLSNFDYKIIGTWQLGEEEEAAKYGAEPGYAKYEDVNKNGEIDPDDRQILGSPEPDFTWSMSNTFKWKNFSLYVLLYGVSGSTKANPFKDKNYLIRHDFWTKDNPTNDFWSTAKNANKYIANKSISPSSYEDADFMRIKDVTLTYTLPNAIVRKIGLTKLAVYFTGKNLLTVTDWEGMDPEFDNQRAIPACREYSFGINLAF